MRNSGLRWLGLSGLVLCLDIYTKYLAKHYLSLFEPFSVFPGFNLALSFNSGAAFGFLSQESGWQSGFLSVIAILICCVVLVYLSRLSCRQYALCGGLSLVLGGALGNLSDRFMYGQVTDFIQLYISHFYWPTFNLADSAICMGALLIAFSLPKE